MFASENFSIGPVFMFIAQKIMKLGLVLTFMVKNSFFWGGLTHLKTSKMLKRPYLLVLHRKLKAEVHENLETGQT